MRGQTKKIQKKHKKGQKGFTMIELILVMTVLGILAVMALPTFYDLTSNAKTSARDGIIGGVKGGINMFRSNALSNGTTPVVPADLDTIAAYPTTCGNGVTPAGSAPCFGNVLQDTVTSNYWVKSAALTYTWAPTVGAAAAMTCTYDTVTGNFTCI
ncbi:MAG: prepilin-type N-terminal cleavage/methylation domain-containing protein [Deltaproteobacteria bacterium]|nr:prepilin-type N-terminal cleavage/methylation domain-containing protein [Deltaproteobacteria bacterium]